MASLFTRLFPSWDRKRKLDQFNDEEDADNDEDPTSSPTVGEEVLVISDDDEVPVTKGEGTEESPLEIVEWVTGNLISKADNGALIDLAEDEDRADSSDHSFPTAANFGGSSFLTFSSATRFKKRKYEDQSVGKAQSPARDVSSTPDIGDDDDEFECEVIVIDDDEYRYTQDWSLVKSEPIDDVPGLTYSQDSNVTSVGGSYTTPGGKPSLQKWEEEHAPTQAELTKLKKKLFFHTYGPQQLPKLTKTLKNYRSWVNGSMDRDQCWLSTDARLFKGPWIRRTISTKVQF